MQEKEKRRRLCAGTLVMGNCQFPGDQPGVREADVESGFTRISLGVAPCAGTTWLLNKKRVDCSCATMRECA